MRETKNDLPELDRNRVTELPTGLSCKVDKYLGLLEAHLRAKR